jgi:TusA-related sulfurtransferase
MRFLKTYARGGRGGIVAALLAVIVSLVVFAGGAATVHAAASPGVTTSVTVLNDDSPRAQGHPSPGGNIGYEIKVANNGGSVGNHFSLNESVGSYATSLVFNNIVYTNITGTPCSISGLTLSCALDKLNVGASIDIVLLYKTDSTAIPGVSAVTNHTVVAFDSQTNGTSNQKTITIDTSRTFADTSLAESISQGNHEVLNAGGSGQTSIVTMPDAFVNSVQFTAAKVQNLSVTALAGCSKCPKLGTQITIPASTPFTAPFTANPFYDGTTQKWFTWSLILPGSLVPNGFKLTGVYHTDSDGNVTLILPCSDSSSPLTNTGICLSTLGQDSSTKTITATGLAFTNGTYQFG